MADDRRLEYRKFWILLKWQSFLSKLACYRNVTDGQFFIDILRFNDFQNGGPPPFWIICSFCLVRSPLSACRAASSYKILLKSDSLLMSYRQKSDFQDGGRPPSWILKILIFGHVSVVRFNICCNVPNFIKIGRLFTEIMVI